MGDLKSRPMRLPLVVVLSALLVLVAAPHAAEDFQYREFETRFGIGSWAAATAFGVATAVQLIGAYLAGRGIRAGSIMLGAVGLLWAVGAAAVHGPELAVAGPYRHGLISKVLEGGLIAIGLATAAAGFAPQRPARRPTPIPRVGTS
jgi:hypothetical protein